MLGSRQLSILAILAIAAVGIAFWLSSANGPSEDMAASGPLIPELSAKLNDVSEVAISAGGQRIATLRKSGDGWVMPERDGYAVDFGELRGLLIKLNEARRIEAKTSNPAHYAKLGVDDPASDAAATGVRVDITAGDKAMGVIVGSNRQGGTGTYVRLVDDAQSWLADRNIAVERRPSRWLQRQLIDIPASRMQSASVEHPAEGDSRADKVAIETDGKSGFSLSNLPKGRELADSYSTDALAGFLADLRFDELASAANKSQPEAGVGSAEFRSIDGVVVSLHYWTEGEQPQRVWASFSVDFDEEQAAQGVAAAQASARAGYEAALAKANAKPKDDAAAVSDSDSDGTAAADAEASPAPEAPLAVTDADKDREARIAAVRAEVDRLRGRFEGRVFELPTFKASNLCKRLDAYLKPAGS